MPPLSHMVALSVAENGRLLQPTPPGLQVDVAACAGVLTAAAHASAAIVARIAETSRE